jgi:hypothetical protein
MLDSPWSILTGSDEAGLIGQGVLDFILTTLQEEDYNEGQLTRIMDAIENYGIVAEEGGNNLRDIRNNGASMLGQIAAATQTGNQRRLESLLTGQPYSEPNPLVGGYAPHLPFASVDALRDPRTGLLSTPVSNREWDWIQSQYSDVRGNAGSDWNPDQESDWWKMMDAHFTGLDPNTGGYSLRHLTGGELEDFNKTFGTLFGGRNIHDYISQDRNYNLDYGSLAQEVYSDYYGASIPGKGTGVSKPFFNGANEFADNGRNWWLNLEVDSPDGGRTTLEQLLNNLPAGEDPVAAIESALTTSIDNKLIGEFGDRAASRYDEVMADLGPNGEPITANSVIDEILGEIGGYIGMRDDLLEDWNKHRDKIVADLTANRDAALGEIDLWGTQQGNLIDENFLGLRGRSTDSLMDRGISGTVATSVDRGITRDEQRADDELAEQKESLRRSVMDPHNAAITAADNELGQMILGIDQGLTTNILGLVDSSIAATENATIANMDRMFGFLNSMDMTINDWETNMGMGLIDLGLSFNQAPPDGGFAQRQANRNAAAADMRAQDALTQSWWDQIAGPAGSAVGSLGGLAIGSALAPATGGASLLYPMAGMGLGGSIGGFAGSAFGGNAPQSAAYLNQVPNSVAPLAWGSIYDNAFGGGYGYGSGGYGGGYQFDPFRVSTRTYNTTGIFR